MKKSFYSLFIAALFSLSAVCAHAAEATSEAVVLKVKGSAQATLPGQTQASAIKVGDKLPQGATITTGSSGQVDLQVFSGAVATIKSDSTVELSKLSLTTSNGAVTKQTALVNLKVGSVVSKIDPANKAINDYGVRTPKGVAAARGTEFTVFVEANGQTQVFVTESRITFTNTTTGQSVTVEAGSKVTVTPDGVIQPPVSNNGTTTQEQQALEKNESKTTSPSSGGATDSTPTDRPITSPAS